MLCRYCGAQAPDDAVFCSYCGGDLRGSAPASYDVEPPEVNDFLAWNILASFFCFMPFGIVGVVFSALSLYAKEKRDWAKALEHAANAKKFFVLSLAVWGFFAVAAFIGFVIFAVVGALGAAAV